jgi:hypothetical protein
VSLNATLYLLVLFALQQFGKGRKNNATKITKRV